MLKIEIVSDLVCPWCFIGLRRLDLAIEEIRRELPDFEYSRQWRPFFLNPDTPPEGEPYLPFLEAKFGGRAQVEALFERVRAAGAPYGIDYAFEKITLRANTLQAHRLIYWAQLQGDAGPLVERLFIAQFQRGEYVGDRALLANIAGECGYDPQAAAHFLNSDEASEIVRELEHESRRWGVKAVPSFVVDRKFLVAGAEDPRLLAQAIREALGEAASN